MSLSSHLRVEKPRKKHRAYGREQHKDRGTERRSERKKQPTYLHVTFCHIERSDAGVGDTAREGTAEHALGVVAGIVGDGAEVAVSVDWR